MVDADKSKSTIFTDTTKRLKVMNYNIWFAETFRTERMIALVETILHHNPDVICMQEVIPKVYEKLILMLNNYKYHYPEEPEYNYNCVIFSKYPFVENKCGNKLFDNTKMGRSLVYGTILKEGKNIIVGTSHFESLFQKFNYVKVEQFKTAKMYLEDLALSEGSQVIFCSDTNIVRSEEASFINNLSNSKWKDPWIENGRISEKEYTYDSENNDNLKNRKLGYYRSRIDRIVYLGDNITTSEFTLVKGLPELIEPSDHFGVMASFLYS